MKIARRWLVSTYVFRYAQGFDARAGETNLIFFLPGSQRDNSMLTFETESILGAANVVAKLTVSHTRAGSQY